MRSLCSQNKSRLGEWNVAFEAAAHSHRRYNPLMDEWILISPHRAKRPWQGSQKSLMPNNRPRYHPKCYLCPGNVRANGDRNPDYDGAFAFTNDFAAVLPDAPQAAASENRLFQLQSVQGQARVICFSPRHDLTLAEMSAAEIRRVVDLWGRQTAELGRGYAWVQVFENRGAMMGASNPHPHGQIWATDTLGSIPKTEDAQQKAYHAQYGSLLLMDYVQQEMQRRERIVLENTHWTVVVPYWAVWPFETLLLPKRPVRRLPDLDANQRDSLAEILKSLLVRYDNLFETAFPYSMGWHGAPYWEDDCAHWQLHAHFYPPLLRSATVKKFMVGYEMLAESQRDITAEQAVARLQKLSDIHYKLR